MSDSLILCIKRQISATAEGQRSNTNILHLVPPFRQYVGFNLHRDVTLDRYFFLAGLALGDWGTAGELRWYRFWGYLQRHTWRRVVRNKNNRKRALWQPTVTLDPLYNSDILFPAPFASFNHDRCMQSSGLPRFSWVTRYRSLNGLSLLLRSWKELPPYASGLGDLSSILATALTASIIIRSLYFRGFQCLVMAVRDL